MNSSPRDPTATNYVLEVTARFGERDNGEDRSLGLSSQSWYDDGVLDEESVTWIFSKLRAYREYAEDVLMQGEKRPGGGITVTLWHGTEGQFEAVPSQPARRWARRGELGAQAIPESDLTGDNLRALVAQAEQDKIQRRDALAQNATELQQPLAVRPPYRFKTTP